LLKSRASTDNSLELTYLADIWPEKRKNRNS